MLITLYIGERNVHRASFYAVHTVRCALCTILLQIWDLEDGEHLCCHDVCFIPIRQPTTHTQTNFLWQRIVTSTTTCATTPALRELLGKILSANLCVYVHFSRTYNKESESKPTLRFKLIFNDYPSYEPRPDPEESRFSSRIVCNQ